MQILFDSLDHFMEQAKLNFKDFGYLTPVAGLNINNKIYFMPAPMESHQDKNKFVEFLKDGIKSGLTEFVIISEVWVTTNAQGLEYLRSGNSLSTFHDREEMVFVHYCSPHKEIVMMSKIVEKEGKRTLDKWEKLDKPNDCLMGGRFENLWKKQSFQNN